MIGRTFASRLELVKLLIRGLAGSHHSSVHDAKKSLSVQDELAG